MYPWQTADEFFFLQQSHGDSVTWQHLWSLSYEQLWLLTPSTTPTTVPSKAEFERRRLWFLQTHAKAAWASANNYVVHLHSDWDEFDLLCDGFVQFDRAVAPTFFDNANALMSSNYWLSALYPWSTGDELLALLSHHRQQRRVCVRRWQQLWSLTYEQLWPASHQSASHRSTFEPKRDRFLCRHVQAMWRLSSGWFLVHLRAGVDEATDPFERLSPSGFVCFAASLDEAFFNDTNVVLLSLRADKYPWSSGAEALQTIRAASYETVATLKRRGTSTREKRRKTAL